MTTPYEFEATETGTLYRNSLTVGAEGIIGKLINWAIRAFKFDEARGRAWIKHNIEEVGNFESFLPQLYAVGNNEKNEKGSRTKRGQN